MKVGDIVETHKTKDKTIFVYMDNCDCPCHTSKTVIMHFAPCCEDGLKESVLRMNRVNMPDFSTISEILAWEIKTLKP